MSRDALLLVTTSYPEIGDGSEAAGSFAADIAEELSTRMPVRVVAPGRSEQAANKRSGPEVWRFAGAERPLSLLSPTKPTDWLRIAKVMMSMQRQARAAVADGKVRHILALWALPSGWVARNQARHLQIPYSVWALGSDIWSLGRLPFVSIFLRRVLADASACFADGLQLASDAQRIGGRPFEFLPSTRQTIFVAPNPPRTIPPWRLLFLGRWHLNKGIDLLLEALQMLPNDVWMVISEIVIAGGGPLESVVHTGVERLQSAGRPLRLRGFLDANEAAREIAESDWLLVPSRIESIPLVLSDALKAGRPVIVTPVGDMARIVAGSPACGIVANAATAAAIAAAITDAVACIPGSYADGVRSAAAAFDLRHIADHIFSAVQTGSR